MKSSAKNIVLKSVDDIFQTEENRADAQRERVQEIPLDQLKPFRNHPFKVRDDQRIPHWQPRRFPRPIRL